MAIEFGGLGSGDRVNLGTLDLPGGLSALTILAWCKFNNFDVGDQRIISKATSFQVQDHWFMISGLNPNQMRVRLKTGGTVTTHLEDVTGINTGQWYHMGFVYDGSEVIIYRDGIQNGNSAKTGVIDTSGSVETWIGDNPGIDRKVLDGFITDCRIYSRALSQAEVTTLHASKSRDGIVDGLLHRWLLNEGAPGTAASGAGSSKDLTGSVDGTPEGSPNYQTSELILRRAA